MNDTIVKLARYLHSTWRDEKEQNGYHLPQKCPQFEHSYDEEIDTMDDDLIHCNKCNINMCDFDNLEEFVKKSYYEKAQKMHDGMKEFELHFKE